MNYGQCLNDIYLYIYIYYTYNSKRIVNKLNDTNPKAKSDNFLSFISFLLFFFFKFLNIKKYIKKLIKDTGRILPQMTG